MRVLGGFCLLGSPCLPQQWDVMGPLLVAQGYFFPRTCWGVPKVTLCSQPLSLCFSWMPHIYYYFFISHFAPGLEGQFGDLLGKCGIFPFVSLGTEAPKACSWRPLTSRSKLTHVSRFLGQCRLILAFLRLGCPLKPGWPVHVMKAL